MIPSFGKLLWQREWRGQALPGHLELCAEPAGAAPHRSGHHWSPLIAAGGCGHSATTASQPCQGHQLLVPGCFLLVPPAPAPEAQAGSGTLPARCPPGCTSAAPSGSVPGSDHHVPPTAAACVTFFPFLTQLPFRYLYSVIPFPLQDCLSRPHKLNSLSLCPELILPALPPSSCRAWDGFFLLRV